MGLGEAQEVQLRTQKITRAVDDVGQREQEAQIRQGKRCKGMVCGLLANAHILPRGQGCPGGT